MSVVVCFRFVFPMDILLWLLTTISLGSLNDDLTHGHGGHETHTQHKDNLMMDLLEFALVSCCVRKDYLIKT